jgi:TonB family protein
MTQSHWHKSYLYGCVIPVLITGMLTGCAGRPSPQRVSTEAKPDPDQAYRQLDFYPRESRELSEQGNCSVEVLVGADGVVSEAKVLESTGFYSLDGGCVVAAKARRFIPATAGGKAVASRTVFRVSWRIKGQIGPFVKENDKLHVGPTYYPEISRQLHQEGDCMVSIMVDVNGNPGEATILQSTGYPALDQACLAAAKGAEYSPGWMDGVRSELAAHVFLSWRLTP